MTDADSSGQDVTARLPARPRGLAPLVIALASASAFGAIDQYLQVAIPMSSHLSLYQFAVQVSNGMSALWLLVPFLAGAWQVSPLRAALAGLSGTWLAVLAYVLMIVSPMEGTHLTPRALAFSLASQWPWFAGGLITGPALGWLGHRWRVRRSPAAALMVALPVLLEPAARWLAARAGLGNLSWIHFQWPLDDGGVTAEIAELTVGLLLSCAAISGIVRGRASARA